MQVKLTREMIDRAIMGAATRAQMDVFGVAWPPPKGWPYKILEGKIVEQEQYDRFYEARLIVRKNRKNRQENNPLSMPKSSPPTSATNDRHLVTLGLDADVVQWLRQNRISNDFINDALRQAMQAFA